MSIINRAKALPFYIRESKQGKGQPLQTLIETFEKEQEVYDDIEDVTDKQKLEYEKKLKDFTKKVEAAEEKAKPLKETEEKIIECLLTFEKIKNDPRTEDLLKESGEFRKSFNAKKNAIDTGDYRMEDGVLVSGKVGTMGLNALNMDILVEKFQKHQPKAFDRSQIDKIIEEIPSVTIQSNPELSEKIDHIQSLMKEEQVSPKKIQKSLKEIKKFVPEREKCRECGAENTKYYDGLCMSCLEEEIEAMAGDIADDYFEFDQTKKSFRKDFKDPDDYSRFVGNIEELKEAHDKAHDAFKSAKAKNYQKYYAAFEALNAAIPKPKTEKKSKKIIFNEIDEEEEDEVISSYSQSSSSSSRSPSPVKKSKKREREVTAYEVIDLFQDAHPDLKKLSKVDRSELFDKFQEIKKNQKRYKPYLIDNVTKERMDKLIRFQEDYYPTRGKAEEEGARIASLFEGRYSYMIEEI